jgi:hypothetical protein
LERVEGAAKKVTTSTLRGLERNVAVTISVTAAIAFMPGADLA